MKRSELIRLKSKEWNMTQEETRKIIDQIFDAFGNVLKRDGRIEIRGFGVFELKHRDKTKGRVPGTGEEVEVPERTVPTFSAGKDLKERVNESE